MRPDPFTLVPIARHIWESKYRLHGADSAPRDRSVDETWQRVACAAASVETVDARNRWERRFNEALADFAFLPAGRILAGAGTTRSVTLFNCFVMGTIADDLGSIFDHLKEAALTMQQGGGIGHDFSTLRPRGAPVRTLGADASGPISFMDVWDSMCKTIMSAGARRGAMMGTLRCDHPDIEAFVQAKADPARLRNFNLSVLVTDAFVTAVREERDWDLQFDGTVYRTVPARALWDQIMRATYDYAEPGVIFIDRVNAQNNLQYCETIACTNPCGEQPLPPYGACLLGSINLARLVHSPFRENAAIRPAELEELVGTAVRFLDNIIDVSKTPLQAQHAEADAKRRIGLGVTGLADALMMCGLRYDTPQARAVAAGWMQMIQNAAYMASSRYASEKGVFPLFDRDAFLARPNILRLEPEVQNAIGRDGLRNGCLTSIAPTGTISLLAGNVSSGIEPVFDLSYDRRVLEASGATRIDRVEDYAVALHRMMRADDTIGGKQLRSIADVAVTAQTITPDAHVDMQAALQPWVDSSISKTINCPEAIAFADFSDIYLNAYDRGLKGCTTYRPNPVSGAVLSTTAGPSENSEPAARSMDDDTVGIDDVPGQKFRGHPQPRNQKNDSVVFMTQPLEREAVLEGMTYKLKWPDSADAIYVTINDIERDGRLCPFEIFINTKNLDHYAWTVALTRMISAVFRRGGDVSFVVDELKAIFDPQGGRWVNGAYVPSLLAAIGGVIEQHMLKTGFLAQASREARAVFGEARVDSSRSVAGGTGAHALFDGGADLIRERTCPQCDRRGMRKAEGCWICPECGFSHCN